MDKARNPTTRRAPIPLLIEGGKQAATNREKAEFFGDALEQKFKKGDAPGQSDALRARVDNFIKSLPELDPGDFPEITPEAVKAAIQATKAKSAPGLDGIPNALLKVLPPRAINFLTDLYN